MKNGRYELDKRVVYYLNDQLHRDNGSAVIREDGSEEWYNFGVFHRIDGPAVISIGNNKSWYVNGQLHREDNPAIVYPQIP